jgi:hypothetical protein
MQEVAHAQVPGIQCRLDPSIFGNETVARTENIELLNRGRDCEDKAGGKGIIGWRWGEER